MKNIAVLETFYEKNGVKIVSILFIYLYTEPKK